MSQQFTNFERDEALQSWLERHDAERHRRFVDLKREKEQLRADHAEAEALEPTDEAQQRQREQHELCEMEVGVGAEPEFVAPVFARHQCGECQGAVRRPRALLDAPSVGALCGGGVGGGAQVDVARAQPLFEREAAQVRVSLRGLSARRRQRRGDRGPGPHPVDN